MINLINIVDEYLKNSFSIILNYFSVNVYMGGGSLKDLLLGEKIKDLDFVVICNDDKEIRKFLKEYNLIYKKNKFNGYKIYYNELQIDIWNSTNLYNCVEYNYDALFYNVDTKELISFGFLDCINTKKITKINEFNNLEESEYIRKKKIEGKLNKLVKLSKN